MVANANQLSPEREEQLIVSGMLTSVIKSVELATVNLRLHAKLGSYSVISEQSRDFLLRMASVLDDRAAELAKQRETIQRGK